MMKFNFVTIDTILSKFNKEIKSKDFSEGDLIGWIGEALDFIKIPEVQELAVSFEQVSNYMVQLPYGFHKIQQIARYNKQLSKLDCKPCDISEEKERVVDKVKKDCTDDNSYRPLFDMQWQFIDWTGFVEKNLFIADFTPVRLANSNFFGSHVCPEIPEIRNNCRDEYTILGVEEKYLQFSFQEGFVLVSYYRNILDKNTGFPMIPDVIQLITAISYYLQWKIAEKYAWDGREGFTTIARDKKEMWNEYIRKAKSAIKMYSTVDEYQDIMQQSLEPNINFKKYDNFFNNLAKSNI
jgi:hypothetical protein